MKKWLMLAAAVGFLCAADVPNLTGTWRLNVDKSSWGRKPKPTSEVVTVEHNEPQLTYSGKAIDANGEESAFTFSGAIDGKAYPVKTSYGAGKLTIKRVNPSTTSSVFQSDDGKYTETATMTLSSDQRVLTRRIHLKSPAGDAAWTEVYERQ